MSQKAKMVDTKILCPVVHLEDNYGKIYRVRSYKRQHVPPHLAGTLYWANLKEKPSNNDLHPIHTVEEFLGDRLKPAQALEVLSVALHYGAIAYGTDGLRGPKTIQPNSIIAIKVSVNGCEEWLLTNLVKLFNAEACIVLNVLQPFLSGKLDHVPFNRVVSNIRDAEKRKRILSKFCPQSASTVSRATKDNTGHLTGKCRVNKHNTTKPLNTRTRSSGKQKSPPKASSPSMPQGLRKPRVKAEKDATRRVMHTKLGALQQIVSAHTEKPKKAIKIDSKAAKNKTVAARCDLEEEFNLEEALKGSFPVSVPVLLGSTGKTQDMLNSKNGKSQQLNGQKSKILHRGKPGGAGQKPVVNVSEEEFRRSSFAMSTNKARGTNKPKSVRWVESNKEPTSPEYTSSMESPEASAFTTPTSSPTARRALRRGINGGR